MLTFYAQITHIEGRKLNKALRMSMKKSILLIIFAALLPLQTYGMEPKARTRPNNRKTEILTLRELSQRTFMQQKFLPILAKSINDFPTLQNEVEKFKHITIDELIAETPRTINKLTLDTPPDVLNLLRNQFYDMYKPAITNIFLKQPLINFAPKESDYFINDIAFDPRGKYCMTIKQHVDYEQSADFEQYLGYEQYIDYEDEEEQVNVKEKQVNVHALPDFSIQKTIKIDCDYAQFSPRGKFLSTYHQKSGLLTLFDIQNNFAKSTLTIPKSVYTFNTTETTLLSIDAQGSCQLWDLTTQKQIEIDMNIPGEMGGIMVKKNYIICYTTSNRQFIDKIIIITPQEQTTAISVIDARLYEISNGYCNFALYPEKDLLAISSYSNIFLWNFKTDTYINKYNHADHVNGMSFDASGQLLASASDDWTVGLLNITTGKKFELSVEDSRHIVHNVTFSPQNDILFSSDEKIRLWDLLHQPKPQLLATAEDYGPLEITTCPSTSQGLLFAGINSENIWCAPTRNLFTFNQLIWLYAATWAQKNLKGIALDTYMEELEKNIDIIFPEHTELIRNHLRTILKPKNVE